MRLLRRFRKTQKGGRLVGKGSYACVFSPPPPCADGSKQPGSELGLGLGLGLGKVSVQTMKEEVAIGRALMEGPRAGEYVAVPTDVCVPALPIVDEDSRRCPILEKDRPLTLAFLPDAGVALSKWGSGRSSLSETRLKLLLAHLLEGMLYFQKAGIVHNDIHWGNILVDAHDVGRYIDFGQAFRVADLATWSDLKFGVRFRAEYIWMAPEIQALRVRDIGMDARAAAARLYSKTPDYSAMEAAFPSRKSLATVIADFPTSIHSSGADAAAIRYMRSGGAWRIDWWRLGVCVWTLWNKTPMRDRALRKVVGGLTDFDPRTRMSPAVALSLLRSRPSVTRKRMTSGKK